MMEGNVLKRVIIVILSIALIGGIVSCCLKERRSSMIVKEVTWSYERTIYQWSKIPHTKTIKDTERNVTYNNKVTAIRSINSNGGYDVNANNEPYTSTSNDKTYYCYTINYIKDEWKALKSSACVSKGDYTIEPYDPKPIYDLKSEFELQHNQKIGDKCCDDYVTKKYFVHGTCYNADVTYIIQEADFNKLKEVSAVESEMEIWFSTDPASQYAYNISFEEFD